MKALSVRQPWANLIWSENKSIEVRSWYTSYRGPLIICSSKKFDPLFDKMKEQQTGFLMGMTICMVDLYDCRLMTIHDCDAACMSEKEFRKGNYAWVFRDATPINHIGVTGRLGIFNLDIQKKLLTKINI